MKGMDKTIDITFDFRNDSKNPDPDNYNNGSPTLKEYHKILWRKELPNGDFFNLVDPLKTDEYLWFQMETSEIRLSSDWMINTYSDWNSLKEITQKIQKEELEKFDEIANTIGGRIIFPLNPIGTPPGTYTINTGRNKLHGCKIKDRFDLTLECIRLYYSKSKKENPLCEILTRFDDYFDLFVNFEKFCDFFFLQDLTKNDYSEIEFFLKFHGFEEDPYPNPYPETVDKYYEYMKNATEFIDKRNQRISDSIKNNP